MERRFIEEYFPVKQISIISSEEKSIRHGHISTLHLWWARRPLAVSRATIFSSLISSIDNKKELKQKMEFIKELSIWKNSTNQNNLEKAKKNIEKNFQNTPKILDPFAGGGSIPLEATRLGCETYANDYNPVAVIIQKATLEYPQKYGYIKKEKEIFTHTENQLLKDFKIWSEWVFEEVKKEISLFYHSDDEYDAVGYIWARTLPCQNPLCGKTIPLMSQYWLAKNLKNKIAIHPIKEGFEIVGNGYKKIPNNFDPSTGTISRATITCPFCTSRIEGKITRKLFQEKKNNEELIAVILNKKGTTGKKYRIATKKEISQIKDVELFLKEKISKMERQFGISPIPTEKFPTDVRMISEPLGSAQNYFFETWGDLFNSRQKLSLITFMEKIREGYSLMIQKNMDKEYAKVITTYLALQLDRLVDKNATLVIFNVVGEKIEHVFGRQAFQMTSDYVEINPFTNVGWPNMAGWISRVIEHCSTIKNPINITNHSATNLNYDDEYFDAVITDPPYYDNVAYSHLADFFYVWLKRSIGFLYPELFSTPLSPKSDEAVAYSDIKDGKECGKENFEIMLKKSFSEISRVLKPDGISVIVYAHKSTDGWETLINSLLNSGLVVTAAWPIHTERKARLIAKDSASLSSSIYMVCRKWKKEPIGFYRDVKKELKQYLNKKLEQLWNEGISGADFFISAIGSAIEVFGKYEKVVDDKDETILIQKLLNDTRKIVTNYAINKVIKGEFSEEISQMTRFYILWRWAYGEAKVPFDDALKMAQSVGIDIEHEWDKGFIVKEKEIIRVLGPDERNQNKIEESHELIDILHITLLLWKKENRETVDKFLEEKGYKNSEVFKRVAQAISESLPLESTEKKWLDGFLTGFKSDDSEDSSQRKLF